MARGGVVGKIVLLFVDHEPAPSSPLQLADELSRRVDFTKVRREAAR